MCENIIVCRHYLVREDYLLESSEAKKANLFGGGPSNSSTTPKPETAALVDPLAEIRKQTEAQYSELMDRMEASVLQNGEFFLKLGDKLPKGTAADAVDRRALILKTGRASGDNSTLSEYAVITNHGTRIMSVSLQQFQELADVISGNYPFERNPTDGFYYDEVSRSDGYLSCRNLRRGIITIPLRDASQDSSSKDFVTRSIAESIKRAKETSRATQEKKALEDEQRKLAQAKELNAFVGGLIQPPASKTPPPAESLPPSHPTT